MNIIKPPNSQTVHMCYLDPGDRFVIPGRESVYEVVSVRVGESRVEVTYRHNRREFILSRPKLATVYLLDPEPEGFAPFIKTTEHPDAPVEDNAHPEGVGEVTFVRTDRRKVVVDNVLVESIGVDDRHGIVSMELDGVDAPLHLPFIESWTVEYRD